MCLSKTPIAGLSECLRNRLPKSARTVPQKQIFLEWHEGGGYVIDFKVPRKLQDDQFTFWLRRLRSGYRISFPKGLKAWCRALNESAGRRSPGLP